MKISANQASVQAAQWAEKKKALMEKAQREKEQRKSKLASTGEMSLAGNQYDSLNQDYDQQSSQPSYQAPRKQSQKMEQDQYLQQYENPQKYSNQRQPSREQQMNTPIEQYSMNNNYRKKFIPNIPNGQKLDEQEQQINRELQQINSQIKKKTNSYDMQPSQQSYHPPQQKFVQPPMNFDDLPAQNINNKKGKTNIYNQQLPDEYQQYLANNQFQPPTQKPPSQTLKKKPPPSSQTIQPQRQQQKNQPTKQQLQSRVVQPIYDPNDERQFKKENEFDVDPYADSNDPLFECPKGCGRKFARVALEKHSRVCQKVFQQKRKPFNSQKNRIVSEEQISYIKNQKQQEQKIAKKQQKKKNNWKAQSEAFRAMVKQAKGVQLSDADQVGKQQKQFQISFWLITSKQWTQFLANIVVGNLMTQQLKNISHIVHRKPKITNIKSNQ